MIKGATFNASRFLNRETIMSAGLSAIGCKGRFFVKEPLRRAVLQGNSDTQNVRPSVAMVF